MKKTKFNTTLLLPRAFYRTSSLAHLQLTSELEEVIVGSMLGDFSAERKSLNSNTRLTIKQSTKNEIYVRHLFSLLKDYCLSEPKVMSKFDSRPNKMKVYQSIKFNTLSLPCFNKYKELFYDLDGVKYIPDNLDDLLTAKGLAYWVMDDGYKANKGFYICTESFNRADNQKLVDLLKHKFQLECNYHKHTNGYRVYIWSTSRNKLFRLIKPYLLNHFYYKFELDIKNENEQK